MKESERLERYRRNQYREYLIDEDENLCERIKLLLNHPDIDEQCMVDAYYYDYCMIPEEIMNKNHFVRDMYFIFGITVKGEIVSDWVERYDLDSHKPILNGKVIQNETI